MFEHTAGAQGSVMQDLLCRKMKTQDTFGWQWSNLNLKHTSNLSIFNVSRLLQPNPPGGSAGNTPQEKLTQKVKLSWS